MPGIYQRFYQFISQKSRLLWQRLRLSQFPWEVSFWLLLALLRLWLVRGQSLGAYPHWLHDDMHFMRLAEQLLAGRWLGPFDQFTLIKGPFYSLWIAASFLSALPLLLSEHLLYLLACAAWLLALRAWVPEKWPRRLLLAGLLFSPSSYDWVTMARVIREGIYPALTLLVLACAVHLAAQKKAAGTSPLWSLGLGISLGAFWLEREEGVWLLPTLGVLLVISLSGLWLAEGRLQRAARPWIKLWAPAALIWLLLVGGVSLLNLKYYGVFAKTEMDAPAFKAAFGALLRVKPGEMKMELSTLRKIAAVSPAMAELEPFFAGEPGRSWALASTQSPERFSGDAFLWAFRDVTAAAGRYAAGRFPGEFYQRLADEINLACEQGALDCLPSRSGLTPPIHSRDYLPWARAIGEGLGKLLTYAGFSPQPIPSSQASGLQLFRDLSGERLAGEDTPLQLTGWVVAEQGPAQLLLRSHYGHAAEMQLTWQASPDVYQSLAAQGQERPAAQQARFVLQSPCRLRECSLEVWVNGSLVAVFPAADWAAGEALIQNNVTLTVEGLQKVSLQPNRARWDARKLKALSLIGGGYQVLLPFAAGLALAAYLLLGWRALRSALKKSLPAAQRWQPGLRWLLLSALLGAVLARLLILALITVKSYSALTLLYFSPAHPLLLSWCVLSIAWGLARGQGES